MLAKRKFENLVQTYGDQTISGKKTFTENLVVTGECTLPDDTNLNINFENSSIAQSAIISASGWIYDTFALIAGSVNDLVSDITQNAFGFLKTTDTIPQSQIDQTDASGWINTNFNYLSNGKANTTNPTFSGTVTFPDGNTISVTDEDTSIATKSYIQGMYATKENPVFSGNNVTFPDGSKITEYALKANPTFTGTITMNGDVTLAQTSANTLTLKDHLVLVTGTNFTTPVDGQQGYMVTGTIGTDLTAIATNGTAMNFASITLSYGVWIVFGQIGYYNSTSGVSVTITNKQFSIHSVSAASTPKYQYRVNYSSTIGALVSNSDQISRIVIVTTNPSSANYFLNGGITWSGSGTLVTYAANTNFYAVRIA